MGHDDSLAGGLRELFGEFLLKRVELPRPLRVVRLVFGSVVGVCLYQRVLDVLGFLLRVFGRKPHVRVVLTSVFARIGPIGIMAMVGEAQVNAVGCANNGAAEVRGGQGIANPALHVRPVVDEDIGTFDGLDVARRRLPFMRFGSRWAEVRDFNVFSSDFLGKVGHRIEACHHLDLLGFV